MKRIALLSALAALFAACPTNQQPDGAPKSLGPIGSMQRGIVNGSPDTNTAHTAVAYIQITATGGSASCTGTLVNGSWVVTAAHCTWDCYPEGTCSQVDKGINNAGAYYVCFTQPGSISPDSGRCSYVSEVHRHSDWDTKKDARTNIYSDVAILKLSTNAQTKWGITPIPVLPSSLLSNLTSNTTVEYSGYGLQDFPNNCGYNCPMGTRYHVSAKLDTVCYSAYGCYLSSGGTASNNTICGTQTPGGTCSGDSGGPAFLKVGGVEYVVGATSYGDQNCQYFGCSTNLAKFEPFLSTYLGKGLANGATCSQAMDCKSGYCVGTKCCNVACGGDCYSCSTGSCTALVNSSCNDGNPCTTNDVCNGGNCSGTPKNCGSTSGGGCTVGGTCNLSTGNCDGAGPKADGTACEDGNPCTQGDSCQSGNCTAGAPAGSCPAPDACHEASACNAATGRCDAFPTKPNGTACDDGDPCTGGDSCLAGSCLPSTRVSCPAPDVCHEAGTCNPATGKCPSAYANKANGTACNDGNACTSNDACADGVCKGAANSSACPADQCHAAGTCSAATGLCSGSNKPDGTACNDGDAKTESDVCTAGICKGRPIGLDPCYGAAVGADCDDKNPCTRDDFCVNNVCTGTNPKLCQTPPDGCHQAEGTCNWETGSCVYKTLPQNSACDDGDANTTEDHCENGRCVGTPVIPPDECQGQADGTSCTGGSCKGGVCTKVDPPAPVGGCGCGSTGGASAAPSALLMALAASAMIRRRRR
ncbi:MAG TPA: trypsin-like serine protease [Myxococcales bacterium]|jgi:MYXO-CTERM domain-containing protein